MQTTKKLGGLVFSTVLLASCGAGSGDQNSASNLPEVGQATQASAEVTTPTPIPIAPTLQVTTDTNNVPAGVPATAEQTTQTEAPQIPTVAPEAEALPASEVETNTSTVPDSDSDGIQVVDIGIGIPVEPEIIVIEETSTETTGDVTDTGDMSGEGETPAQATDETSSEIPVETSGEATDEVTDEVTDESPIEPPDEPPVETQNETVDQSPDETPPTLTIVPTESETDNDTTEEIPTEESPVEPPVDPTVHPTESESEPEQPQEETTTDTPEPLVNVACTASQADIQTSTLRLINEARAVERMCGGVLFEATTSLTWNTKLQDAAQVHSLDMSQNNFFSHEGSDGSTASQRADVQQYDWRSIGENIAAGQQTTELVIQAWLDSPGHCANLMDPKFKETAVVCVENVAAQYRQYWTNVLGTSF